MGTLTVITAPTEEPITIAEAKEFLGILHDDDDVRIHNLIKSAREFAESYLNIKIMSQVVERSYDSWPAIVIPLKVWPLQSIDSVKYDDTASPVTEQTLTVNTDYYADVTTIGGRVGTLTGWPSVASKFNPIRIRMTAGYTDTDSVPERIKDGIKAYIGYLYDSEPDFKEVAQNILYQERITWP